MQVTNHESDSLVTNGIARSDDSTRPSELAGVYDRVFDFASTQHEEFVSAVSDRVLLPMMSLAKRLADAHRKILAGLQENGDQEDYWQFQRQYRERVESAIIEPLQQYLQTEQPAQTINELYFSLLPTLESIARDVPASIRISEPPDLFEPDNTDSTGIAFRKMGVRVSRGVKSAADKVTSMFGDRAKPERMIDVPVGDIVTYHVRRRLPAAASTTFKALHNQLAERTAIFEAGVSDWFAGVLRADRELDRHTVESEPEIVESEDAAVEEVHEINTLFAGVIEAGTRLQTALETAAQQLYEIDAKAEKDWAFAWRMFELDLDGCGALVSSTPVPISELGPANIVGGAADTAIEWTQWHEQVVDRLTMVNALIDIRDEMLSLEEDLKATIKQSTTVPFKKAFQKLSTDLETAFRTAKAASENISSKTDLKEFAKTLIELRKTLLKRTKWLSTMPGFIATDGILDNPGDAEWKKLLEIADQLPEALQIHPVPRPHAVDSRAGIRTVKMRETVKQTLHMNLATRLEDKALPLKRELVKAWSSTETIDNIITFNIDAALEEIENFLSPPPPSDDETELQVDPPTLKSVRDTSFELAGEALQRADDSIEEMVKHLEAHVAEVSDEINFVFLDDWTAIHKTVRTRDDASDQWAEVFSRAGQRWEALRFAGEKWFDKATAAVKQWVRVGERSARGLIRKGQTAVGVIDQSDTLRSETVNKIASVASFKKTLPVVYRRLFSFEPLTGASLAEARSRDLVWIRSFATGWKERRNGGVAVIAGDPGSGKTSFLNILGESSLKGFETILIRISDRPNSEKELVAVLAEHMGITTSVDDLMGLEEILNHNTDRRCVLIDDIEHLFLQATGGKELLERFMLFLSRTDKWICWFLTINKPAWKYLARTAQRIVGFVVSYELSTVDRSGYEAIVLNRHRRSGMPIVFEQPKDGANYLKDKVGRKRTESEIQDTLRENYFDTLRKLSGQNIMLALYYWTLSAQFKESGELLVKPIKPLSFDFLGRYDTGLAFSLRSIIMHKTLSVEEHNRVFSFSKDETTFVLERLVNDRLICLVDSNPDTMGVEQPDWYSGDVRFEIHPLVQFPVSEMLSRNNLLH